MKPIRILISDDHAIVRIGLTTLLRFHKNLKLVGEADDSDSLLKLAAEVSPDVIIMDLMMPGLPAAQTIATILQRSRPAPRILILTSFGSAAELNSAVRAGVSGVILKGAPPETLVEAILTIAGGGTFFSEEVKRTLTREIISRLTERQSQVLKMLAQGKSNSVIATELGISADAVKQHLSAIYAKLGADNRAEAVAIALKKHLLKI